MDGNPVRSDIAYELAKASSLNLRLRMADYNDNKIRDEYIKNISKNIGFTDQDQYKAELQNRIDDLRKKELTKFLIYLENNKDNVFRKNAHIPREKEKKLSRGLVEPSPYVYASYPSEAVVYKYEGLPNLPFVSLKPIKGRANLVSHPISSASSALSASSQYYNINRIKNWMNDARSSSASTVSTQLLSMNDSSRVSSKGAPSSRGSRRTYQEEQNAAALLRRAIADKYAAENRASAAARK